MKICEYSNEDYFMIKMMMACFETELTYLQKKEIEIGRKHGLKEKEINLYASREYNYLQMREIRLCFEHGIEYKKIKKYMNAEISFERMHQIRMQLEAGKKVKIDYQRYVPVFLFVSFLLFLSLFPMEEQKPYLELVSDTVVLQCGQSFDPMSYVKSFSSLKGELILPSSIDTNQRGNYVVVYRFRTVKEEIEKLLYVKVQ